jgi:hypothetical protein
MLSPQYLQTIPPAVEKDDAVGMSSMDDDSSDSNSSDDPDYYSDGSDYADQLGASRLLADTHALEEGFLLILEVNSNFGYPLYSSQHVGLQDAKTKIMTPSRLKEMWTSHCFV